MQVVLVRYWAVVTSAVFSLMCINWAVAADRPVVVIPGIEGSQLCNQSGEILWGDRSSYTYKRISALRIPFGADGKASGIRSCGLINNVSIIPLFYQSQVYSTLLTTLHELGFQDKQIIIFDYDWRLSNFENAAKLRDLVVGRLPDPSDRVDIVAHSMGGIIARIYIQMFGGEARVQNFIMMGTPNLGSAKVFSELKNGFDSWPDGLSGGLVEIQRTILSFPSTYQLLPMYDQCCGFSETADSVNAKYADILSSETWSRFGWLPDEFKSGKGQEFLARSLEEANRLKALLAKPLLRDVHSLSKVHFVANGFMDTWSRVFFHPKTGKIVGNTTSPGDGTVLLFSATNGDPAQFQLSPMDHEHIFSGKEAALLLRVSLAGTDLHAGSGGFEQQIKDANGQDITVTGARFELNHHLASPSSPLVLTLTLRGTDSLQSAALPDFKAELLKDGTVLTSIPLIESPRPLNERSFHQTFAAPAEVGPYSVRLSANGLPPIETIFAVMSP